MADTSALHAERSGRRHIEGARTPRTLSELVTAVTDEYDVTDAMAESTTRDFLELCMESLLVKTEEH
jgi:hypothetical protein